MVKRQTRLGEMFRLYRTVRGRTLRDIAPSIGIGHATLQRIENGQAIDAETLLRLWTWMLATGDEVTIQERTDDERNDRTE